LKHDRDNIVLDSVSFSVPAGSVCAIAGPSGVGKSTIADLLLRFYDPLGGVVKLDGHDLREIRLADLRREVALVEQSPILFNTTIAENIQYGCPDAGLDDIMQAARAASIEDFIMALPDGFDTQVGEAGQTLSAGERQRMAIARALLRNPAVIVLDEPTASLDPVNEQNIAVALSRIMQGRTTIVISHRASLIQLADIVVVMDGGRVVETGHPHELMGRGGALASLFAYEGTF
jgi:ABC-type multidrug transport system fused ATPase/permease subunit